MNEVEVSGFIIGFAVGVGLFFIVNTFVEFVREWIAYRRVSKMVIDLESVTEKMNKSKKKGRAKKDEA